MSVLFYTAKTKEEAGSRLISLAETNKSMQETRRQLAAKYASLYEGMSLSGLAPYGYTSDAAHYFRQDQEEIPLIRNAAHSIVDTWVSKIAAIETPKPSMITSHGAWTDRRTAKKLEQLVEAEYYEPQGRFSNLEELWIHAVRIAAACTGSVAVKVQVYPNEQKITHEIHDTLTMFFDYGELTYGDLLTVGEITWFDVDRLLEIFPGKANEELIKASIEKPPEEFRAPVGSQAHITEMVALYEGWRGMQHAKKPGKYCAAVRAGCLEFRDYEYPKPPFVMYVPDPHLYGIFGHCITHHIYESVKRDNLILSKIDRSVSKAIRNHIIVDKLKLSDPEAFDVIEDDKVIDMTDVSALRIENAQGFHSSHKEIADSHWLDAHNVSGVPELHTAAKGQPGVTAAIADRQIAARLNERFAAAQRRYVQAVAVDDAKLIIQGLKEVRESQGKFTKLWAGSDFLKEIDSDALDLPEHKYRLRPAAVSGRQSTPEGRLQTAFELRQMGILSDEGFAAVQQAGFDVPEELDDRNVDREWMDEQFEQWMMASDEEIQAPDFYQGPIKFMKIGPAIDYTVGALMEALIDKLEPERVEFFLLFLSDLDALLLQSAQNAPSQGAQLPVQPAATAPAPAPKPTTGIALPQLSGPPQLAAGPPA
jgi:hypothetical protein